jgi:hypothetical protein
MGVAAEQPIDARAQERHIVVDKAQRFAAPPLGQIGRRHPVAPVLGKEAHPLLQAPLIEQRRFGCDKALDLPVKIGSRLWQRRALLAFSGGGRSPI